MLEPSGPSIRSLTATILLFSLLFSGCAAPPHAISPSPRVFRRYQVVVVWSGQKSTKLRAVSITRDSVRGQSLRKIDGTRPTVVFATNEVDSLGLLSRGSEAAEVTAWVLLAFAFWFVIRYGHGN
jgi:hypothetical protein